MRNFRILIVITIILFLILAIADTIVGIALWWYGLLFILWFLMMAIGSFSMSWKFYLNPITSHKVLRVKKIALTFDDGPNPEFTLKVLQILKDYNAKATFFCIGQHIETYPEILKAIAVDGHDIGNHSFSHDLMIDFNSTERWLQEIKQTDNSIHKITGKKATLFRPPFGVTTPKLARALKVTEHKVIGWNIRSFDTVISNPQKILKRITKRVHPGAIILLHDKQSNVLLVLEHLLQFLQEHEYQAVTINELLHDN